MKKWALESQGNSVEIFPQCLKPTQKIGNDKMDILQYCHYRDEKVKINCQFPNK